MKTVNLLCNIGLLAGALTYLIPAPAQAQIGTAFSYQGYLLQTDQPVNNPQCLEFRLFDAPDNGSQIGTAVTPCDVPVQDGRFTVNLDFGAEAFSSSPRWLEITVDDTTLSPRQRIMPAPVAMFAQKAAEAQTATEAQTAANGVPAGFSILGDNNTPPPGYKWSGKTIGKDMGWTTETPIPTTMELPVGGVINENLYLSQNKLIYEYSPATSTWTRKLDMPVNVIEAAGAALNGELYVIGGQTGQGVSTQVFSYNPVTDIWTNRAPVPDGLSRNVALAAEGKIHLLGGDNRTNRTNAHYIYDPTTDTWTTGEPMPTARRFHTAVYLNGNIHVLGGEIAGPPTDLHDIYNIETGTWSTGTPLPIPVTSLSAVSIAGRIHVMGGLHLTGARTEHHVYDPNTGAWTLYPPLTFARTQAHASPLGDKVFLSGGRALQHGTSPIGTGLTEGFDLTQTYYVHIKQ